MISKQQIEKLSAEDLNKIVAHWESKRRMTNRTFGQNDPFRIESIDQYGNDEIDQIKMDGKLFTSRKRTERLAKLAKGN